MSPPDVNGPLPRPHRLRCGLLLFLLLGLPVLSACGQRNADTAIPATTVPAVTIPATTAPPTETVVPTATPQPEPPVPTPQVDLTNRSIYQRTLRPELAADVDIVPNAPHYFVQALLIPGETPHVVGIERVRYINQQSVPLNEIYFRLYPAVLSYGGTMTVTQVVADHEFVQPSYEMDGSALRIPLREPLQPGVATDITLWFDTVLPTQVEAGTAGSGLFGYVDGIYDLAAFYPTIPVYDEEGWSIAMPAPTHGDGTFTDTSFYHVLFTAPDNLKVVASGSTIDQRDNEDGTHTWHILAGPVRAFYVTAAEGFEAITEEVDGIQVNSYYLPGGLQGAQTALSYTTRSLQVFNRLFSAYPYREFDVVPMPTTAFGMEYPGLIALAASFYGEDGGAYSVATVHEVAHQWWYNLVGNDQLSEPWIDESLANYSVYLYYEAVDWAEMQETVMNNILLYRYQAAQNLGMDRPVGGAVNEFEPSNYINIVYSKGALFFHALRQRMGDEAFFAALQTYASDHRYGVAYPADLLASFQSHSEQPLDDIYREWITGDP